jgi:plasmid stability protein
LPTLIIRDVPEITYRRLKDQAVAHRRSLAKEALVVLEARLDPHDVPAIDFSKIPQFKFKKRMKFDIRAVEAAINEGRE